MAIVGSLGLPTLARRFTLKRVLLAGVVADTLAMALLVGSVAVEHDAGVYADAAGGHRVVGPRVRPHPRLDQHLCGRLHARPARRGPDGAERAAGVGHGALAVPHRAVHRRGAVVVPAADRRRRAGRAVRRRPRPADGRSGGRAAGRQGRDPGVVLALRRRAGDLRRRRDDVRQLGDDAAHRPRGEGHVGPGRPGRVLGLGDPRAAGHRAGRRAHPLHPDLRRAAVGDGRRPGARPPGQGRRGGDRRLRLRPAWPARGSSP